MYEGLMEEAVLPENLARALAAVQSNKGAPGIDRMRTDELEEHVNKHWEKIRNKLLAGTYQPVPVLRVEIPKPGGGVRLLGIPTVMDRMIQQLLLQVLTPIFEPTFSNSSWGFRPGRSAHDAVRAAQGYIREGKDWVVDLDIEKFFDRVNWDILMTRIGKTIRDKRVLKLIGRILRSGVMVNGVVIETEEGTPQGGPLSPLLANIYLDPMDKELESRGHSFSRYADDSNIYVGSEPSAQRVMESMTTWIAEHLRLKVNAHKSGYGRPWDRKFLGFRFTLKGEIAVSPESLDRFQVRARALWDARHSGSSKELRDRWQRYIRGWWNYYRLAEWRRPVLALDGWLRRHMRKCFWLRWHNRKGRLNALHRLGLRGSQLKVAASCRGAWRIAHSPSLHTALSNARLRHFGFLVLSDLTAA
jgi:group II intron reverse transcriptase/maturase